MQKQYNHIQLQSYVIFFLRRYTIVLKLLLSGKQSDKR